MEILSLKQESRLINYLDEQILILSRNFNNRNNFNSIFPTISNYLEALLLLVNNLILPIPIKNSTLRISYLLYLTNLLPEAFSNYSISNLNNNNNNNNKNNNKEILNSIFSTLKIFDKSWILVLRGKTNINSSSNQKQQNNNNNNKKGERDSNITGTDLVRLESIILEIRNILGEVLGTLNRVDNNRINIDRDASIIEPNLNLENLKKEQEEEEDEGIQEAEEEETPSLVTQSESEDNEDITTIVKSTTTTTLNNSDSSDSSDSNSDSDFEEVEISNSETVEEQVVEEPSYYNINIQVQNPLNQVITVPNSEIFEILPTNTATTTIIRRGFDPDEEFIDELSDEDNLNNLDVDDDEEEEEKEKEERKRIEENKSEEFLEEEVEKIFQSTLIILREFRLSNEGKKEDL